MTFDEEIQSISERSNYIDQTQEIGSCGWFQDCLPDVCHKVSKVCASDCELY
jgi:hypothetical protein